MAGLESKLAQLWLDDDKEGMEIVDELKMLTWNTNYSTGGHAPTRDTLICVMKKQTKNCITFLQEVKLCADSVKEKWAFDDECKIATCMSNESGTREAAVSTPPAAGRKGLQYETDDAILDESGLKKLGVKDEFASRMCGQKVTLKRNIGESEYIASITVISYHAHYKISNKHEKMLEYFKEMCKFADSLKQTIIIGGDFNLPVLDWKEEVEKKFPNQVSVALYVGTPRRWVRDKLIDTFAIVQPIESEYQTKATFKETVAVYPFPIACNKGDEPTTFRDYPSSDLKWFKYVNFSKEDLEKVKETLIKKDKNDLEKKSKKKEELQKDVEQKK